jgi:hypothetical protein
VAMTLGAQYALIVEENNTILQETDYIFGDDVYKF